MHAFRREGKQRLLLRQAPGYRRGLHSSHCTQHASRQAGATVTELEVSHGRAHLQGLTLFLLM